MESLLKQFSFSLFFEQTIIFLILLFILKKFAWRPILDSIKSRENNIKNALEQAKLAHQEIKKINNQKNEIINQAKIQSKLILQNAYQIKEKIISESNEKAQNEAKKIIQSAKITIENQKKIAKIKLKNEIAIISINIAEKILKKELSNKQIQQKLIENLIEKSSLN